ncbi:MAG: 30S ribosomal protein S2 [Chloroflexi bacterium RIFOXYD12_FULL_57_15]|nr:MAG: 30S ribosomal protein S2 [Chloroflexi bacterium RIFOXYD12_FULL_57_15]
MAIVSMKALLESGVHFGHRTNKWDPRMKPYIFTERNGIHIIDLQQTVKLLNQAFNVVRDAVANGGTVLFVGTKRQAQETVKEEALRCGMPYVTERWLGGMLTNWSTMYARIQELDRLEKLRETGEISRLTKKEGLLIGREIDRLLTRLEGVRKMKRLPEVLFLVDVGREDAAVREANLLKVPMVAMVDTNCNPQNIDYVIPSNDDAIRAIKLLVARIADAVLEGKAMRKEEEPAEETPVAADAERSADAKPARPRKGKHVVEAADVDEVGEVDLLGESTLAKLSEARKPAEVVAVEEALPVSEETPEVAATPPEVKDEAGAEESPAAG